MNKCVICEKNAPYVVKNTTNYYCETHAIEFFGDVTYLVKADTAANVIKDLLTKSTSDDN